MGLKKAPLALDSTAVASLGERDGVRGFIAVLKQSRMTILGGGSDAKGI